MKMNKLWIILLTLIFSFTSTLHSFAQDSKVSSEKHDEEYAINDFDQSLLLPENSQYNQRKGKTLLALDTYNYSNTNDDGTDYRQMAAIMASHSRATGWRVGGWICLLTGIPALGTGIYCVTKGLGGLGGGLIGGGCVFTGFGIGCFTRARDEEYTAIQTTPILEHDFAFGDVVFSPSLNLLQNTQNHTTTPGIGLCVSF